MKPYYVLFARINDQWSVEFGDYDQETVQDERDDYKDRGYRAKHLKILRLRDATQHSIDIALGMLRRAEKKALAG